MTAAPLNADIMLALMRGGAPNAEVLLAKRVEDLFAVAERHNISLPAGGQSDQNHDNEGDANSEGVPGPIPPTDDFDDRGSMSGRGGRFEGQRNKYGEWEGFGRYTFSDGSLYEGEWRANQQEGVGTFWYALSGNKYHGQWRAGMKHGHGMFGYADGRVEVGTYVRDSDVGEGAMWSADRRTAWRIVEDGVEVAEISLDEAMRIAACIGESVPTLGDWLAVRRSMDGTDAAVEGLVSSKTEAT